MFCGVIWRCAICWFEEFFGVVSVGFECLHLIWVAMHMRHTPPAPLERGDWGGAFFVGNEWVECKVSPLERGLKGVLW